MWKGKVTKELEELAAQYAAINYVSPASYDELCYDAMTYDEFVGYIKEALRRHCDIVAVIDELEADLDEDD